MVQTANCKLQSPICKLHLSLCVIFHCLLVVVVVGGGGSGGGGGGLFVCFE